MTEREGSCLHHADSVMINSTALAQIWRNVQNLLTRGVGETRVYNELINWDFAANLAQSGEVIWLFFLGPDRDSDLELFVVNSFGACFAS